MLRFRLIEYGSCAYHEMVTLRDVVLRKPLGLDFSPEYLQQEMNDWLVGCYVTEAGKEQLAGCCILTPVNEHTVQLRQMAVNPALQGKGIGSSIMAFAEQESVNNGFTELVLHARKAAALFYEKLGYRTQGHEFTEVGIPHFEMKKNLANSKFQIPKTKFQ